MQTRRPQLTLQKSKALLPRCRPSRRQWVVIHRLQRLAHSLNARFKMTAIMPSVSIVRGIVLPMLTSPSVLSSAQIVQIFISKLLGPMRAISSRCSRSPGTLSSYAASNSAVTNDSSTSYKSILGKEMLYLRSIVRPRPNTIDECSAHGPEACVLKKNVQRRIGVNMFPRKINSTKSQKEQQ